VQSVSLRRTEKRRFLESALIGRSFPQSALKAILSLYKIAIRMIVEVGWMILIAMCCFAASRFSSVPQILMMKSARVAHLPLGLA
jgi:hypothetical protein